MKDLELLFINELTVSLITKVKDSLQISLMQAMDMVYGSDTFSRLERPETGLYTYGSLYVSDMLMGELHYGSAPTEL